jgi:hypothetical protein
MTAWSKCDSGDANDVTESALRFYLQLSVGSKQPAVTCTGWFASPSSPLTCGRYPRERFVLGFLVLYAVLAGGAARPHRPPGVVVLVAGPPPPLRTGPGAIWRSSG